MLPTPFSRHTDRQTDKTDRWEGNGSIQLPEVISLGGADHVTWLIVVYYELYTCMYYVDGVLAVVRLHQLHHIKHLGNDRSIGF